MIRINYNTEEDHCTRNVSIIIIKVAPQTGEYRVRPSNINHNARQFCTFYECRAGQ